MFNEYSLYNNTKNNGLYRDFYQPLDIKKDSTDYFLIVTSEYHNRPGKMAFDLYGSERLYWIFSYFNRDKINDLIFDFEAGMILRVPKKERLMNLL